MVSKNFREYVVDWKQEKNRSDGKGDGYSQFLSLFFCHFKNQIANSSGKGGIDEQSSVQQYVERHQPEVDGTNSCVNEKYISRSLAVTAVDKGHAHDHKQNQYHNNEFTTRNAQYFYCRVF